MLRWTFREALTRATLEDHSAIEVLFSAYEAALTQAGFLAMGGQIIDASIIAAPKQRNTDAEKREIKAGRIPPEWKAKPAKLAQKDRDARWTVKWSKAKPADDGSPRMDLAVPAFGYKNHLGVDRHHGLIRTWVVTDAARHDGAQLPALISKANTASDVWADTAYRSRANERHLANNGLRSQIHRKKPKGKPMAKLSITHILRGCCEGRAERDVGQPREAAPHDHVARRRISGAREIAPEPCDLDEVGTECLRGLALVGHETIQDRNLARGEREPWIGVQRAAVHHRHPEHPPA